MTVQPFAMAPAAMGPFMPVVPYQAPPFQQSSPPLLPPMPQLGGPNSYGDAFSYGAPGMAVNQAPVTLPSTMAMAAPAPNYPQAYVPGLTPSFAPGFDSAVLAQPELNYAVATMPQSVAPFGAPSNPYAPPAPVAPFGAPNPYAAPAPVAPFGAPPSPYPTPGFAPFNPIAPGALPPAYPAPPAPQPQFGPAPMQSPFASPVPAPMTAYNQAPSPTPFFNPGFNASLPANPFSAVAQPALASNGAGLSSQRAAAPSLVSVPESARLKSIAANYDQVAQRYKEAATVYESAESVNQYNPQLAQTIISDHFQRHPF